MATAIAVFAALGAAFCFAVASVVQQGAARASGEDVLSFRLLLALVRQPRWLAGIGLAGLSFVIQGLALAFGPLALVQPLAATDVLFALPLVALLRQYRLTRRDWAGVAAVVGGIAAFLAVSPPSGGKSVPPASAWGPAFLAVAALTAVAALAARRVRGRAQVVWLAVAAGAVFAFVDALTKSTVDLLTSRGVGTLATWEPYALLAAGTLGALFGQSAFRSGALSLSLPVIDTLEPVAAVAIAATVFNERLAASPGHLAGQLAGGAVAAVGIALLSHSSIVDAENRRAPTSGSKLANRILGSDVASRKAAR